MSRTEGADSSVIKAAARDLRARGVEIGVTTPVNICILCGPTLLADLTDKADSTKPPVQVVTSHLSHVDLREGKTGNDSTAKRGEMLRRSTPYAFHDGTVDLYFMGFCREQAPMRERMEAIYGTTATSATPLRTTRRNGCASAPGRCIEPMTDAQAKHASGALLAGRLDFGWWASNGPTAGYLVSLVLESVRRLSDLSSVTPRSVDLRIVRLAAADDFDVTAAFAQAAGGVATVMVTLAQREPFATASVQLGRRLVEESTAPSHRLGALPPEAYAEMEMGRADQPPVTGQFRYRPATNPDGTSPEPGWDLVWVSPRAGEYSGHEHIAKILDCWYPASYMRAVREHVSRARPPHGLSQPAATNLLGAHVEFTSPEEAYADLSNALLASRLKTSADGYQFEQQEIWSDRGDLLVDAQIVRRQERQQVAHSDERRP